jgi:hypothetical protein
MQKWEYRVIPLEEAGTLKKKSEGLFRAGRFRVSVMSRCRRYLWRRPTRPDPMAAPFRCIRSAPRLTNGVDPG